MRISLGLAAILLGLALAAPASAQNPADYTFTTKPVKPKPTPQPTVFQNVKNFTAKAFDYNTYLPKTGTTDNAIKDPRLLPTKTPSELLVNVIDVARPDDKVKFNVH
jgi:hypothetical protein